MARISMSERIATLERNIGILSRQNDFLKMELRHKEEINKILKERQYNVEEFSRAMSVSIDSLAHTITDIRQILKEKR